MHPDNSSSTEPVAIATRLMGAIERAWNTADGTAFAAPFAEDADFVDIRGVLHRTRATIAEGHCAIFGSIYKGSTVRYDVIGARLLGPGCIVAHARARLEAPAGPLAGIHGATQTLVIVPTKEGGQDGAEGGAGAASGRWAIAAFHNTLVTA